jgi:hypothetical protein
MKIPTYQEYLAINEAKEAKEKDTNKKYPYGCAMLYFDFPQVKILHEKIEADDIYDEAGHGIETEPHVTLLYGLHDSVEDKDVLDASKGRIESIQLHNASIFKNDKFEVLKFDANGQFLHDINKNLSKLPHTTDYPDYHPHCTIAYLKPGKGEKYAKMFNDRLYEVFPKKVVYSKTDGSKKEIGF